MSDLQKTVEIIFQGTDSISKTLNTMSGKVDKFGDDLADIGQPFADATTLVLALDAAIAGLAVAGITASSNIETAAGKMTASLGITNEEAEKFKGIAEDVYKSGVTSELTDAFDAVTLSQKKLGDNASVDIGKVTTEALTLQKTMGIDLNDSIGAVDTLMNNFGLTSDQAFDFIVAGYQKGLNGSGDFLESINEYSTQFSNGGADASQFFSVLESGFSEGMLGTDKAADAFKEFRVRIQDESETTNDALKSLGIDPVEFGKKMASGELTAIEAFNTIIGKLNETENQTILFNAGVGLMGTQFEDLGTKAALELSTTKTNINELSGVMQKVADDAKGEFATKMLAAYNTVTTEFGKLEEWESAKDAIAGVFEDLAKSFGDVMSSTDFGELEVAAGEIWDKIAAVFTENSLDLTTVEGMQNAVDLVSESIGTLLTVTGGIVDIFTPLVGGVIELTEWFNSLDERTKALVGNILGVGTGLVTLGGILSVGGSVLSGLGRLTAFFTPGGVLITGLIAVGSYIAKDYNKHMENIAEITANTAKETKEFKESLEGLPEETKMKIFAELDAGNFEEANKLIAGITEEEWEASIVADVDDTDFVGFNLDLNELPEETVAAITAAINAGDFKKVEELLQGVTDKEHIVDIKAEADVKQAMEDISWFDEDGKEHTISVPVETSGIEQTKKDIEALPSEKLLEIKLQGDIDTKIETIKTQAETVQTALEWTAKVDIAGIEATANMVTSAFESSAESVSALSTSVGDMFGAYISGIDNLSGTDKWNMQDMLEDQQEAQNKLIDAQVVLTKAQSDYLLAKTDSMKNGDGTIKIDCTGAEPEIEMVMWKILEKVQVRATQEQADFLLGI